MNFRMTPKRWFWGLLGAAVIWNLLGNKWTEEGAGKMAGMPESRVLNVQMPVFHVLDFMSVPATFVFGGTQRVFEGALRWSMARPDAGVSIEQLQERIQQLEAQNLQLTGLFKRAQEEIVSYRSILRAGIRPEDTLPAHVLAAPIGPGTAILHLDKGTMDGVQDGMVVVAPLEQVTVLGRVMDTGAKDCKVRLILDPQMKVRADIVRDANTPITVDPVIVEGLGTEMGCQTLNVQRPGNLPEPMRGDYVRLVDPAWPNPTHFMLIGRISEVGRRTNQALRYDLRIQPIRPVSSLTTVMIVVK